MTTTSVLHIYVDMLGGVYFLFVTASSLGIDTADGLCAADYLRHEKSGDLKRKRVHGAIAFRRAVPSIGETICIYMYLYIYDI